VKTGLISADDATLVAQLKSGDMDALSALYLRHKDPVYTYCLRFGIGESESKDIVHDVFLRARERVTTLTDTTAFRPWLLSIARNIIFNKRRNEHLVFGDPPEIPSTDDDPLAAVVHRDSVDALRTCIDALDPLSREMLDLKIVQELSYREIATLTGVTEEAVRTRLYRARKAVTEHLHRKEGLRQ
jgi:RNA polymerase sigma-70 factor, ECF subfamily